MHILIGGGSGFIGSALTQRFRSRGDEVTKRTLQAGYRFRYPALDGALADLVRITF